MMSENIVKSWTENTTKLLTPIHELNKSTFDNLAKVTEIQFSTAKYLTDISLDRLRAATDIGDFAGASSFSAKSIELASEVNKKLIEDSQHLFELGSGFRTNLSKLFGSTAEE